MKEKQLVVKDNTLINAAYTLDLVEQRLILLAIVSARKAQQGIDASHTITIRGEDYAKSFNVSRQAAYIALNEAAKSLFKRQFSYEKLTPKGNIEKVTSRWVSDISYIDKEGAVMTTFTRCVIPLITKLEKHFTSYELQEVAHLRSIYAIRLYELLMAWRSTGKTPKYKLQDFRKKLGLLDDEYERADNFKTRVLDTATTQINQHTDINISWEQYKEGRRVAGFQFTITSKKEPLKKGRKQITKKEAERLAKTGETYTELYGRLAQEYIIG